MKFKFTCELCGKQVKRGDKFTVEIFKAEDECVGHGVESADPICNSCTKNIVNRLNYLRRKAKQ